MRAETPITLVACCGPKLDHKALASDIYISPLFRKAKSYAEVRGAWYILSALHGLLDPSTEIDPYNVTLKKMSAHDRREWGQKVRKQIDAAGLAGSTFVALAGANYVRPLELAGLAVTQPMKGLGIGKQLQWLTRQNSESHID